MAEAIVSVVMEQLVSIIRLELEQEVRQVVGVRQEVSNLNSTLEFIKAGLDDAEKRQFRENAVKVWMGALKDIMYDADDVLDEWYTTISISQSQHKRAASGSRTTNKVFSLFSSPFSCFQHVVRRHDIAVRIKDIRGRLDDVARDKEHLNLLQCQSHQDNRLPQLTSSIVDVSVIHGRELDEDFILSRVLAEISRALAENSRALAEISKVLAENSRVLAEAEAENSNELAKKRRVRAEAEKRRLLAEAEKRRVLAEDESSSVLAENTSSVLAESSRVLAENSRMLAEAEKSSVLAESSRVLAENSRMLAEAENNRVLADISRVLVEVENIRVLVEVENIRVLAEVEIYKALVEKNELIDNAEAMAKAKGSRVRAEAESRVVLVISIVGMGGLGKTTLAQLVFEDEQITTTFELKIWVCVSEPFDRERVAKEIIEQASGQNMWNVASWEILHQHLCSSVKGKRFLLVLDDVWTENPMDWTPFKLSLGGGATGSTIIVTTRSERVAVMVGSSYTHTLKELSEDVCWTLFRHIAFQGRSQEDVENLEEIGQEITKKCKGIPLAAKTVASLMQFKRSKEEWRSVLQSDIWELGKDFFPALLLSYHALPAHLKHCFMYTAIFPKGTTLEKDRLVKLWIAQGFVRSNGEIEPETVAREYFDDLAMRSFFQDFERDVDGKVTFCKMHDFLHSVAQSLTKDECHIMETNETSLTNNKIRHLNVRNTNCPSPFMLKNVRTLILSSLTPEQVLRQSFLQTTCLRALDLHGHNLTELPSEVEFLVHLRYLDLSKNGCLKILPETLCNLYKLQTLKLNDCKKLVKLPERIGQLSNLRHLEIENTCKPECFPRSIGGLFNLRALRRFVVNGASGGCKIGVLRDLDCLSGSLEITGLRQVESMDASKGAQMLKKKDLRSLELNFSYTRMEQVAIAGDQVKRLEGVLEGLQPNANLERLGIWGYPGLKFPFWMSSGPVFSSVIKLELSDCTKCTELPALGNLKCLEHLSIERLESVKHIGAEFYGEGGDTCFPKLKTLSLYKLLEVEYWDSPLSKFKKVMPRLKWLTITSCRKLMRLPALGRLESLESIDIRELGSLKALGTEFLGISSSCNGKDQESNAMVVFPSLRTLEFRIMEEWEEWNFPLLLFHQQKEKSIQIMPNLWRLSISECRKLRALPDALGVLPSLERIELSDWGAVKHVGANFVRISGGGFNLKVFPTYAELMLMDFPEWEDEQYEETTATSGTIAAIMPSLQLLEFESCPKLKMLPTFMFPRSLRRLELVDCPQLMKYEGDIFFTESQVAKIVHCKGCAPR